MGRKALASSPNKHSSHIPFGTSESVQCMCIQGLLPSFMLKSALHTIQALQRRRGRSVGRFGAVANALWRAVGSGSRGHSTLRCQVGSTCPPAIRKVSAVLSSGADGADDKSASIGADDGSTRRVATRQGNCMSCVRSIFYRRRGCCARRELAFRNSSGWHCGLTERGEKHVTQMNSFGSSGTSVSCS